MWSWGRNNAGQLGQGNTTYRSSPVQIGALTNWSKVSAATGFTLAVKTDGTLWSWGQNNAGQLGTNNITYYSSPKQIGSLTTWFNVGAGLNHFSISVKTDGTLWSWGSGSNGQLGLNNLTNYSSPKQVGSLTGWVNVACGNAHTLSIG
jgi:alpha-tubulin suppressor-like RCC1 family protein